MKSEGRKRRVGEKEEEMTKVGPGKMEELTEENRGNDGMYDFLTREDLLTPRAAPVTTQTYGKKRILA